jgi:maltooligosyltrehalose trehalohydrolase
LLTGENNGYYADFRGTEHLLKALKEGYVYSGQYSQYRQKRHGRSSRDIPPNRFVVFSQNHDQIGNRMLGERLVTLAGLEAAKLAAGLVILSPYLPLLFMGEEYGEDSPFLFFTSYSDPALAKAVREGRKNEFGQFDWQGSVPDPQDLEIFKRSKIHWQKRYKGRGKRILKYYNRLIHLRRTISPISYAYRKHMMLSACGEDAILFIHRHATNSAAAVVVNLKNKENNYVFPFKGGIYFKALDSADKVWQGPGSSLPKEAKYGDDHVIRPFNLAVFIKHKRGERK